MCIGVPNPCVELDINVMNRYAVINVILNNSNNAVPATKIYLTINHVESMEVVHSNVTSVDLPQFHVFLDPLRAKEDRRYMASVEVGNVQGNGTAVAGFFTVNEARGNYVYSTQIAGTL